MQLGLHSQQLLWPVVALLWPVAHSSVIHVSAQASLDCWMYQCIVCCLLSLCLIELSWPRLCKLGWSEVLLVWWWWWWWECWRCSGPLSL